MSQLLAALRQIDTRRQRAPVGPDSLALPAPTGPQLSIYQPTAIDTPVAVEPETEPVVLAVEIPEPVASRPAVEVSLDDRGLTDYRALGETIVAAAPDVHSLLLTQAGKAWSVNFSAVTLAATLCELGRGPGLLFSGRTIPESVEEFEIAVCPTTVPGLSLWNGASPPPHHSGNQDLYLWDHLRQRYRFVLLDIGPLRTGHPAAAMCDASLLVVELGTTTRAQANRAIARLVAAGSRLLGSVVVGGEL